MNWSRVKSIMIFFLIGINVFLLIVFGLITYRENYIPDSVIDAAASVLASEGFPCDSDLIPNMYKSAAVLNTDFYTASELSDAFFGRQLPVQNRRIFADCRIGLRRGKADRQRKLVCFRIRPHRKIRLAAEKSAARLKKPGLICAARFMTAGISSLSCIIKE